MRDTVSIARVKLLHPAISKEVENIIDEIESIWPLKMAVRIVQGLRTFAEQDALYQQGRTVHGPKVTNAKAGESYHNYGLAIDFCLLYDMDGNGVREVVSWDLNKDEDKDHVADWMEVVAVFKMHGYTWGGDWKSIKDNPHLQKTFGHNWKQLLILYANHNFIPDTNYVRLDTPINN